MIHRMFLRFLAAALLPLAALAQPADSALSAKLGALADRYYEAQARFDPVYSATLIGDNRFDDQLPVDIAPEQQRARFAMYHEVARELAAIPRAKLDERDRLTHEMLDYQLRMQLGFERFDGHLLPLQQLDSIPIVLANFASGQAEQPLKTVAQYDAYLRRIGKLPAWSEQAIANMREGMRRGIVQPKPVTEAVLKQLKQLGAAQGNPFLEAVKNLPADFSAADKQRLTSAYREAVGQRIAPAMGKLADFVEREYLPASRTTMGWSQLPNGAAWYQQWVRSQTTTNLSPDEIHQMGLKEVARIQGELAKLAPKLGYAGPTEGLLAWVRTQPKFLPFRTEAEVLAAYRELNARLDKKLPALFRQVPRASIDIRPEPELTRATSSDHYSLPAEDGSRPGVFWAVINDPAAYDMTTMTALFLHEGRPGHHFQMALQQEMPLPQFRKRLWVNAYGEGWALYAESLGQEMGLYEDPAAYVGELRLEIFRAARLVVDTGLHAKGWTRDQAIDYLAQTTGFTRVQAANQIDRYMAWPAQALGYKLGQLKIRELRERAKRKLGESFDLAAFHAVVLGEGAMPLSLLEERVDRWIDRQLKAPAAAAAPARQPT
jgi:uncharacterized protein (DUF885 family)